MDATTEIQKIKQRIEVWSAEVNPQRRKDALRLLELLDDARLIAKNWKENYDEMAGALGKAGRQPADADPVYGREISVSERDRTDAGSCTACSDPGHRTVTEVTLRPLIFRLCGHCRRALVVRLKRRGNG